VPIKNYGAYKLMISREYKYTETLKGERGRRKIELFFWVFLVFPLWGDFSVILYFIDFMDRPFPFLLE
jgi:hypothetical protein